MFIDIILGFGFNESLILAIWPNSWFCPHGHKFKLFVVFALSSSGFQGQSRTARTL